MNRGAPDRDDAAVADRLMTFFPEGAPDVAIGGLSIARSTIVPADAGDDGPGLHWHVYGSLTGNEAPPFILFGDLALRTNDWFIGATAVALVLFRDASTVSLKSDADERLLTARLGPWASSALYDTAASAARRLVASSPECDIDVPYFTPDALIGYEQEDAETQIAAPDPG